jgi:predicted nucleic acid-binding protein
MVVFLDAGPLGMASNPKSRPANEECRQWLRGLVAVGARIVVPEIADYEVRRELLRAGKTAGIERLVHLENNLEYLPITTHAMHLAAELWANVRRAGSPTAADKALDGDVILAAQALTCGISASDAVVATTNVGHLVRFISAKECREVG